MIVSAPSMFERRLHALLVGLVLISVAAVVTVAVAIDPANPPLLGFDRRWQEWIVDARTPWLTRVAKVMSVIGGPFVMVPLRLAVIGALAATRRWLQLAAFLGAVVTSELCIGPLKALLDRPRPPVPLVAVHSASFPSGHAIAASVTAIGLVVVVAPAAGRRWRWTCLAAGFAALMAMSRTYLGAHWASDVIAGVCLGTGLALIWPAALELARGRRRLRAPAVERVVAAEP
jgi:membrane-associated phospholipid phosphatase